MQDIHVYALCAIARLLHYGERCNELFLQQRLPSAPTTHPDGAETDQPAYDDQQRHASTSIDRLKVQTGHGKKRRVHGPQHSTRTRHIRARFSRREVSDDGDTSVFPDDTDDSDDNDNAANDGAAGSLDMGSPIAASTTFAFVPVAAADPYVMPTFASAVVPTLAVPSTSNLAPPKATDTRAVQISPIVVGSDLTTNSATGNIVQISPIFVPSNSAATASASQGQSRSTSTVFVQASASTFTKLTSTASAAGTGDIVYYCGTPVTGAGGSTSFSITATKTYLGLPNLLATATWLSSTPDASTNRIVTAKRVRLARRPQTAVVVVDQNGVTAVNDPNCVMISATGVPAVATSTQLSAAGVGAGAVAPTLSTSVVTTSSSASSSINNPLESSANDSNTSFFTTSSGKGTIAGISVGGAAVAGVLIIVLIIRKRRQSNSAYEEDHAADLYRKQSNGSGNHNGDGAMATVGSVLGIAVAAISGLKNKLLRKGSQKAFGEEQQGYRASSTSSFGGSSNDHHETRSNEMRQHNLGPISYPQQPLQEQLQQPQQWGEYADPYSNAQGPFQDPPTEQNDRHRSYAVQSQQFSDMPWAVTGYTSGVAARGRGDSSMYSAYPGTFQFDDDDGRDTDVADDPDASRRGTVHTVRAGAFAAARASSSRLHPASSVYRSSAYPDNHPAVPNIPLPSTSSERLDPFSDHQGTSSEGYHTTYASHETGDALIENFAGMAGAGSQRRMSAISKDPYQRRRVGPVGEIALVPKIISDMLPNQLAVTNPDSHGVYLEDDQQSQSYAAANNIQTKHHEHNMPPQAADRALSPMLNIIPASLPTSPERGPQEHPREYLDAPPQNSKLGRGPSSKWKPWQAIWNKGSNANGDRGEMLQVGSYQDPTTAQYAPKSAPPNMASYQVSHQYNQQRQPYLIERTVTPPSSQSSVWRQDLSASTGDDQRSWLNDGMETPMEIQDVQLAGGSKTSDAVVSAVQSMPNDYFVR